MDGWYSRSKPNSVKPVPWFADNVIEAIEQIINKNYKVIEHGAGGSTLWFADRVEFVMSFENDPDWYRHLLKSIPNNVQLIFNNWPAVPDNWRPHGLFDLLVIDGEPVAERGEWITESPMIVKNKGYVILDNANRPEYELGRKFLHSISESVQTFDNNYGTQYLTTDICRLK